MYQTDINSLRSQETWHVFRQETSDLIMIKLNNHQVKPQQQ